MVAGRERRQRNIDSDRESTCTYAYKHVELCVSFNTRTYDGKAYTPCSAKSAPRRFTLLFRLQCGGRTFAAAPHGAVSVAVSESARETRDDDTPLHTRRNHQVRAELLAQREPIDGLALYICSHWILMGKCFNRFCFFCCSSRIQQLIRTVKYFNYLSG